MLIRELASISALNAFTVLTGTTGMIREITHPVLLEYGDPQQAPAEHYKNALLVTTLYHFKDQPETLCPALERLMGLGAVGLAYKTVYFDDLPQEVIDLAVSRDFVIIKFDDLCMEDVILSISDYMRLRQEFSLYEEALFKILQGTWADCGIENLCARINPNRQKYMNAVYIHSSDLKNDWAAHLRQRLRLRNHQWATREYRFLQFRRGFFVICNHEEMPQLHQVGQEVMALLQSLDCDISQLCFGVGAIHQHSEAFDSVIREAFDALLFALIDHKQLALFPELKLYHAVIPMVRDQSARLHINRLLGLLQEYDRENASGNLMHTLMVHSENGYDISKTAEVLGQHPNTIRYRLKKICDLTATPRESAHALFLLGEYVRVDTLSHELF